jgi:hypothetical protein
MPRAHWRQLIGLGMAMIIYRLQQQSLPRLRQADDGILQAANGCALSAAHAFAIFLSPRRSFPVAAIGFQVYTYRNGTCWMTR